MKIAKFLMIGSLALLAFNSCKKKQDPTPDPKTSNITGMELHYTGGIAGFNEHYLITDKAVLRDTGYVWTSSKYTFDFPLSTDKFNKVKDLPTQVPSQLYKENHAQYGTNNKVADGTTLIVVLHTGDISYNWTFEYNTPAYVQSFEQKAYTALNELRK